jgi:hypothetical protein
MARKATKLPRPDDFSSGEESDGHKTRALLESPLHQWHPPKGRGWSLHWAYWDAALGVSLIPVNVQLPEIEDRSWQGWTYNCLTGEAWISNWMRKRWEMFPVPFDLVPFPLGSQPPFPMLAFVPRPTPDARESMSSSSPDPVDAQIHLQQPEHSPPETKGTVGAEDVGTSEQPQGGEQVDENQQDNTSDNGNRTGLSAVDAASGPPATSETPAADNAHEGSSPPYRHPESEQRNPLHDGKHNAATPMTETSRDMCRLAPSTTRTTQEYEIVIRQRGSRQL